MSTKYIAGIVVILATLLPLLGVEVGTEQLTTTLQTLFQIGGGLWVVLRMIFTKETNIVGKRIK